MTILDAASASDHEVNPAHKKRVILNEVKDLAHSPSITQVIGDSHNESALAKH